MDKQQTNVNSNNNNGNGNNNNNGQKEDEDEDEEMVSPLLPILTTAAQQKQNNCTFKEKDDERTIFINDEDDKLFMEKQEKSQLFVVDFDHSNQNQGCVIDSRNGEFSSPSQGEAIFIDAAYEYEYKGKEIIIHDQDNDRDYDQCEKIADKNEDDIKFGKHYQSQKDFSVDVDIEVDEESVQLLKPKISTEHGNERKREYDEQSQSNQQSSLLPMNSIVSGRSSSKIEIDKEVKFLENPINASLPFSLTEKPEQNHTTLTTKQKEKEKALISQYQHQQPSKMPKMSKKTQGQQPQQGTQTSSIEQINTLLERKLTDIVDKRLKHLMPCLAQQLKNKILPRKQSSDLHSNHHEHPPKSDQNILHRHEEHDQFDEKEHQSFIHHQNMLNLLEQQQIQNLLQKHEKQRQLIHKGFKCQGCTVEPIKGIRYQCMKCVNFNLCSVCEEVIEHQHNLLKVKKVVGGGGGGKKQEVQKQKQKQKEKEKKEKVEHEANGQKVEEEMKESIKIEGSGSIMKESIEKEKEKEKNINVNVKKQTTNSNSNNSQTKKKAGDDLVSIGVKFIEEILKEYEKRSKKLIIIEDQPKIVRNQEKFSSLGNTGSNANNKNKDKDKDKEGGGNTNNAKKLQKKSQKEKQKDRQKEKEKKQYEKERQKEKQKSKNCNENHHTPKKAQKQQQQQSSAQQQQSLKTKISKREARLSKLFQKPQQTFRQFVLKTIQLPLKQIINLYASQHKIDFQQRQYIKKFKRIDKLGEYFNNDGQKYVAIVAKYPNFTFLEMLNKIKEEGIDDYTLERYRNSRVKMMRTQKVFIRQPLLKEDWIVYSDGNGNGNVNGNGNSMSKSKSKSKSKNGNKEKEEWIGFPVSEGLD